MSLQIAHAKQLWLFSFFKIPASAVEMPGSADVTGLNVQFGALEFGSEPALPEFGSTSSSENTSQATNNSLYSKSVKYVWVPFLHSYTSLGGEVCAKTIKAQLPCVMGERNKMACKDKCFLQMASWKRNFFSNDNQNLPGWVSMTL